MTTKIILPAIGIPSILLILACFTTEPSVIFGIIMHIVVASTNIFLTKENREFKLFGRTIRSRDDKFDYIRWITNLVLLDPVLYYLLNPSQTVHFACWTMLTVAALIDTYKKSYRLRVVLTSAVMFFISHSVIFPSVGVVEKILLTSVLCSFVFVVWAIESRFLVSMIQAAERAETVLRQETEMEKMESEAAFGKQLRIISHEINNTLAVLSITDPIEHAEIMQRAIVKLRTISTLVLEGASGSRPKAMTSVKILLEEIRMLVRPMVTHNGCKWIEKIDEKIQDDIFEEYAGASFLILQNFVKNSVEEVSKKNGNITFEVKKVDNSVLFSIQDNGGGLAKSPFLEIESNVSSKKTGHGIGLKFVLREAKKSGFEVGCNPGPGSGAMFWISSTICSGATPR